MRNNSMRRRLDKALELSLTERLALQDDMHDLAAALTTATGTHDAAVRRLIDAGYADTPLRVIERLAREAAEIEEQP